MNNRAVAIVAALIALLLGGYFAGYFNTRLGGSPPEEPETGEQYQPTGPGLHDGR